MRLMMLGTIAESMLGNPSVLVVFAASALLFGPAAFAVAVRRGWQRLPAVLAGAGLALALAVTQGRQPFEFAGVDLSPCSPTSSGSSFSETLLNTGMLMPFGSFAAYATGRALGPALFCLAASLLTEAAQATFDTGACVGQDILANTLGGSLAAAAGFALHRFRTRRGRTAGEHDPPPPHRPTARGSPPRSALHTRSGPDLRGHEMSGPEGRAPPSVVIVSRKEGGECWNG